MQDDFNRKRNRGKTTMTFRLLPEEKLKLSIQAKELGMSPSQYAEVLILGHHNEIINEAEEQNKKENSAKLDLELSNYQKNFVNAALKGLQRKFKNEPKELLLLASVFQVFNNENTFLKDTLKDSLPKVKQKIKKHKSQNHD